MPPKAGGWVDLSTNDRGEIQKSKRKLKVNELNSNTLTIRPVAPIRVLRRRAGFEPRSLKIISFSEQTL